MYNDYVVLESQRQGEIFKNNAINSVNKAKARCDRFQIKMKAKQDDENKELDNNYMDTVFGEQDPDDLKAKMVSRIVNCAIYKQA